MSWTVGCAAEAPVAARADRPDPTYRPGQSIQETRLCGCLECFERKCCSGETGAASEPSSTEELGLSIGVCTRCTRRVWPARGGESCSERAPVTCCPESLSE